MDYWRDGVLRGIAYWIYDFQGLIGGILALIAALVSMLWLHRHRQDNIRRKNFSDRAGMAIALSEICSYARLSIEHVYELYRLWANSSNGRPFQPTIPCPTYPQAAFDKIQRVIENADPKDAKIITEFIANSQVQNVRMVKILGDLNRTNGMRGHTIMMAGNFYGYIFDALGVYKFADRMFEYARVQSINIPDICSPEEASNSLSFMLTGIINDDLFELVELRWPPSMPDMLDL